MPLNRGIAKKTRSFDMPVSFKINETRDRLRDALNVFSNQGRLETRFGRSLLASLSGSALSMTFYKNASDVGSLIAKVGTAIYSVTTAGSVTSIKTGLSATTKHRGLSWARGATARKIYGIGSDGLFQWNGSSFTQLGQAAPVAPSVASSVTAGTLSAYNYKVYLTYYSSSTGFESNASTPVSVSVSAFKVIQDLTYRAKQVGAEGNLITVTYTAGATAGAETIAVTNNAINVTIATGVTTANQIKTIIEKSVTASDLVSITVSGTGTTGQVAAASTPLADGRQTIAITSIPATAANTTIDTVRIYLKDSDIVDDAVFAGEVLLGTTTYNITSDPTSTNTFPLNAGIPPNGGGKYLLEFNRKLAVLGNSSYPNDVIFSEEDIPDAFNDGTANGFNRLYIPGPGVVTGGAVGLYNNSVLDPYMVIFKRRSTHIYSEIGGESKGPICISDKIGCVSFDSIIIKNGDCYFLSDSGWRVIRNGQLVVDEKGNSITLGMGDVDDIFRAPGYVYQLNRSMIDGAFSVYYSTLDQYLTWVPEGSSTEYLKAYAYEFQANGFKPFQFYTATTCACVGEDAAGDEVVFMADSSGKIYTHSIKESRADDDTTGTDQPIDAFAMMTWVGSDDMDTTCNFRNLHLRRVVGSGDLTVKTWKNYNVTDLQSISFSFTSSSTGPLWDEAEWDEDIWPDERNAETVTKDINRSGENILIGFYQSAIDTNLNLISAQLDYSINGNRN